MKDGETCELGAIHMSNAIALTGKPAEVMKHLESISPANLEFIQKHLPFAELRVNQLLQDALAIETIDKPSG